MLPFFFSLQCFAQSTGTVESAIALFRDADRDVKVVSLAGGGTSKSIFEGEGQSSSIRLGYTGKHSDLKDSNSLLVKDQLDGKTTMMEESLSLSIDQGIRVGTVVSFFSGISKSPVAKSNWYGAKIVEWWLDETLQTTIDLRQTSSEGDAVDFTDFDNLRVTTPEKTKGQNISLGVMNFTTPTTILRGNVSRTTRSDRPPASAVTAEIRQFVTVTDSAVHIGLAHYENLGTISKQTTYGEIVSNSAKVEWHQNLSDTQIIAAGYRYYLEEENPRSKNISRQGVGTDSIYLNYRQRFGEGPRAAEKNEAYVFCGKYSTSENKSTVFVGFGGRLNL